LGYFSLKELDQLTQDGVFWLSRLQSNTAVFDLAGNRLDLLNWLESQD